MKIYLAVFASVFMAELGDKTQLATLTYAASPGASPLGVFVAAAAALILSSALAVLIGSRIERCVAPAQLQLLAGLAFHRHRDVDGAHAVAGQTFLASDGWLLTASDRGRIDGGDGRRRRQLSVVVETGAEVMMETPPGRSGALSRE